MELELGLGVDSGILRTSREILSRYPLCDRCLGRLFANLGWGLSNADRGRSIKILLAMELHMLASRDDPEARRALYLASANGGEPFSSLYRHLYGENPPASGQCYICGGRVDDIIERFSRRAGESIAALGFRRFIIGVKPPSWSVDAEREIASVFSLQHWESIKSELKREIGKRIARIYGLEPDFDDPEVMVVLDIDRESIEAVIPSITLGIRVVKMARGLRIRRSGGRRSLEDLLSKMDLGREISIEIPIRDTSRYRILGGGCEAILEIRTPSPGVRDGERLSRSINSQPGQYRIEILGRGRRRTLEEAIRRTRRIVYRAYIYSERDLDEESIKRLEGIRDTAIEQKTPERIARLLGHSSERSVSGDIRVERVIRISRRTLEILFSLPTRIYVEEAITGDNGRTSPSISSILGSRLYPLEIDIVGIEI
jgi:tRNA pseudouridine synthase 10